MKPHKLQTFSNVKMKPHKLQTFFERQNEASQVTNMRKSFDLNLLI